MYWTQTDNHWKTKFIFMETLEEYHAAIAKGMRKSPNYQQITGSGVEFEVDGWSIQVMRPEGSTAGHEIKMLRDKTYLK